MRGGERRREEESDWTLNFSHTGFSCSAVAGVCVSVSLSFEFLGWSEEARWKSGILTYRGCLSNTTNTLPPLSFTCFLLYTRKKWDTNWNTESRHSRDGNKRGKWCVCVCVCVCLSWMCMGCEPQHLGLPFETTSTGCRAWAWQSANTCLIH